MNLDHLPNFFIIGAAKSGTTSLYHYLRQQPQIYFPREKEPHFFDSDTNYAEGVDAYLQQHFANASSFPIRGEATPWYLYKWEKVIPRMLSIYSDNPPKFVVLLRDPVKRAWSHYLHMLRNQQENLPFHEAFAQETERLRCDKEKWIGYYSEGLYVEPLQAWFKAFGRKQFRVYLTEDLAADPKAVIQDISSFCEVAGSPCQLDLSVKNAASVPVSKSLMRFVTRPPKWAHSITTSVIPKKTRRRWIKIVKTKNLRKIGKCPLPESEASELYNLYAQEINSLELLLGRDLSGWRR
jgi:hypothetical protein